CGPRFSIVRALPYDRPQTTMDAFRLCPGCLREYETSADRRFHAEPNACPACGPTLAWVVGREAVSLHGAALVAAQLALAQGRIVAVKGAGGFALAVDAENAVAVARLRERKHRPHKPLAVMVRDLTSAERIAEVDSLAAELLMSPARPIVLL